MTATTTTEHLQLIQESARDFAEAHIRPHVMEWDEDQISPSSCSTKWVSTDF